MDKCMRQQGPSCSKLSTVVGRRACSASPVRPLVLMQGTFGFNQSAHSPGRVYKSDACSCGSGSQIQRVARLVAAGLYRRSSGVPDGHCGRHALLGALASRTSLVVHAVAPDGMFPRAARCGSGLLRRTFAAVIAEASRAGATSVAIPSIGCGVHGWSPADAAQEAIEARRGLDAGCGVRHSEGGFCTAGGGRVAGVESAGGRGVGPSVSSRRAVPAASATEQANDEVCWWAGQLKGPEGARRGELLS